MPIERCPGVQEWVIVVEIPIILAQLPPPSTNCAYNGVPFRPGTLIFYGIDLSGENNLDDLSGKREATKKMGCRCALDDRETKKTRVATHK